MQALKDRWPDVVRQAEMLPPLSHRLRGGGSNPRMRTPSWPAQVEPLVWKFDDDTRTSDRSRRLHSVLPPPTRAAGPRGRGRHARTSSPRDGRGMAPGRRRPRLDVHLVGKRVVVVDVGGGLGEPVDAKQWLHLAVPSRQTRQWREPDRTEFELYLLRRHLRVRAGRRGVRHWVAAPASSLWWGLWPCAPSRPQAHRQISRPRARTTTTSPSSWIEPEADPPNLTGARTTRGWSQGMRALLPYPG